MTDGWHLGLVVTGSIYFAHYLAGVFPRDRVGGSAGLSFFRHGPISDIIFSGNATLRGVVGKSVQQGQVWGLYPPLRQA